jgi:hypothetical protein
MRGRNTIFKFYSTGIQVSKPNKHETLLIFMGIFYKILTGCTNVRCGTRKPHGTRSTIELRLLSNEGLHNHNGGTTEDIDS